jgi:hypothetical protein
MGSRVEIKVRSAINAAKGTTRFSKRSFLVPECSVKSVIAYEGARIEDVRGQLGDDQPDIFDKRTCDVEEYGLPPGELA